MGKSSHPCPLWGQGKVSPSRGNQNRPLWGRMFIQDSSSTTKKSKSQRQQEHQQSKTIQQLSSELRRKDKALAEAAALLVLQKKFQALWTESEDEKLICSSAKK